VGTEIDLRIAGITLECSKNVMGADHGFLFQAGDWTRLRSDQLRCDETDGSEQHDAAFVRRLGRVIPRLDLLGHSIESSRLAYEQAVGDAMQMAAETTSIDLPNEFMSFEEFGNFCRRYPLSDLEDRAVVPGSEKEAKMPPGRFAAHADEIRRIPSEPEYYPWLAMQGRSEKSYLGSKVFILDAYSMLQVLGQDGANADAELMWLYGPLVESGWEDSSSFFAGARRRERVLVATEGSSDVRILKRALEVLRPDVADFFDFIDVNESHPFWGTGRLVDFAVGLVRIDVQNRILFLLDNDAEGLGAYRRLRDLGMPANMRAMVLPDHDAFRCFRARGPEGVSMSDINGRAAAIECYLDLELPRHPPAQVLWSNYKKDVEVWQGALEFKEAYAEHFYKQSDAALVSGSYDTSRLQMVLDRLIAEALIVATSRI
jgi:hypothetical protein